MTEHSVCIACGALILPATAKRTGGLCTPCYGGYRQDIEASRRYRAEEKEYERSPAWRYWAALIQRANDLPNGFDNLSAAEKTFYAMRILVGDVCRGGFYHYFAHMAEHYDDAVKGLKEIGATQSLGMVLKAKELLVGPGEVPSDQMIRENLLPDIEEFETQMIDRSRRLDEIERAFYADPENLYERCEKFAGSHGLYSEIGG